MMTIPEHITLQQSRWYCCRLVACI